MTELKREYVVPLRRKSRFAPKWRRSKKAVSVLNEFIKKHMKTDNVVICNELNEYIWEKGIKNPPGKVEVVALKTQINGSEKTIVNLLTVGVDKYLEQHGGQVQSVETSKEESKEKTAEVVDAKVTEVAKKNVKNEEMKDE